ncbi:T9SS type A sorting domain-containing protein [Hymenobacter sp. BRD128]|uniref:T9SS type A sorting domain-containing protein n=1 Tax=Hymenobacter sp. BRD128 TaxID=2675878 RepID=UPI00156715B7|nr:T9SS type A sorting domain-containing protein [Hymenobacter sp. BRD128]QKG55305.1 T9SS type A sorting domain-containing protein [Hymenobacter sp. BRD128]
MQKIFTLSTLVALTAASLSAQAQFTVDGTLSPAEIGTGTGKYQLVGTYTGTTTHSVADRGLKALYVGTTATTLNIMVVASPETTGYNALALYLDVPNKTGVAAGTRLGGGDDASSQLRSRPTLDMQVDYAFRVTTSPLANTADQSYYSKLDYTATPNATGQYPDKYLGPTNKTGTPLVITDATTNFVAARFAFQSSASGSVAANTTTGWEMELPLASLGGVATGSNINMMVAYLNDGADFNSDVLPQIAGLTTALGTDPNFTTIPGNQYYTYQVGTGVLASRAAASTLPTSLYPNPVAASSRLSYTLTGAQPVTVTAYNSLGQAALTLLDAAAQPAGEHSLALAPLQQLAAGVYLLQVRAGSQLTSQRVVVQ